MVKLLYNIRTDYLCINGGIDGNGKFYISVMDSNYFELNRTESANKHDLKKNFKKICKHYDIPRRQRLMIAA